MRKAVLISIVLILTVALGLTGCQPHSQPATFTDDGGRTVSISVIPQRIVSHVPGITEMLFALGLGDKVVGVSDYCDFPEEAKQKPSVGNYFNPSIERIVSLDPDLVLTDGHSDSIKQLESVGIPYVIIEPKDIDGIFRDIALLGEITNVSSEARNLVDNMRSRIDEVTARVKDSPRPKIFYIIDAITDANNPWTAGRGSFIDSLISLAGGDNIAAMADGAYLQFSLEQVVSFDPDIVIVDDAQLMGEDTMKILREHPVWSQLDAIKNDRLFNINGDLTNPVPRIVEGLETMARIFHPEKF